jgi:hypothetical protein
MRKENLKGLKKIRPNAESIRAFFQPTSPPEKVGTTNIREQIIFASTFP